MPDQPFAEEGYTLMGAAFEVHNIQGGGLSEDIYQQSLEIELQLRGIPFRGKQELDVFYKGRVLAKNTSPTYLSSSASSSNSKPYPRYPPTTMHN